MRARNVAVVGVAAAAGAAALGAHHLRDAPANMRRYSMPSVGVYDLVTHLLFRGRYDEIARGDRRRSARWRDGRRPRQRDGRGPRAARDAGAVARRSPAWTSIPRWSRGRRRRPSWRDPARAGAGRRSSSRTRARSPSPTRSVDLLVSSYAVHHLPDRHAARAEIIRVLKPGGRAIIWDVVSPHGAPGPDGHAAPRRPPTGGAGLRASTAPARSMSSGCSSGSAGSRPSATSSASRRSPASTRPERTSKRPPGPVKRRRTRPRAGARWRCLRPTPRSRASRGSLPPAAPPDSQVTIA